MLTEAAVTPAVRSSVREVPAMFPGGYCAGLGVGGWLLMIGFWGVLIAVVVWAVTRLFPSAPSPRRAGGNRSAGSGRGQGDGEGGAVPGSVAGHGDRPSVSLDECFDDGEPDTRAAVTAVAAPVDPVEALEHVR